MEWQPTEQPEHGAFWPGEAERRSPRWVPIFVAVAVVMLVVAAVVWWLGRGDSDDTEAVDSSDDAAEVVEEPDTDAEPTTTADQQSSTDDAAPATTTDDTPTSTTIEATDSGADIGPTTTVAATTTTITTVPPDNTDQFGPPTLGARSTVSTVGLDTVHFGMSVAQAQEAAGTVLVPAGPTGSCYHVVPYDAPEGIVFLVHAGTVERVDINSGPITTRSGVGVGSPESLVTDLFGDSLERQVRVDGTVDLVFVPSDPGDRNYRVVFNISEGVVRAFKSGRLPQVMLDTGCESP